MRHLYNAEPKNPALIEQAKTFERRRCNHHTLEKPLSTMDCLKDVVDPKENRTNKHRYVVATQDEDVRAFMRRIPGVPMIYIHRSVMILEPMANSTEKFRSREEKGKFKAGLRDSGSQVLGKRSRGSDEAIDQEGSDQNEGQQVEQKKKRKRGPKGPNPLSVKKAKKSTHDSLAVKPPQRSLQENEDKSTRKRKRKRKPKGEEENAEPEPVIIDNV